MRSLLHNVLFVDDLSDLSLIDRFSLTIELPVSILGQALFLRPKCTIQ